MTDDTIWQINASSQWYSRLGIRVWSATEVTLGVWPVAPGHRAGAVWTTDGWQTVRQDSARWRRNIANPFGRDDEEWVVTMIIQSSQNPVRFWYALYVEDGQGIRYWDNNNGWNYENIVP
jgi:hypothetical protein